MNVHTVTALLASSAVTLLACLVIGWVLSRPGTRSRAATGACSVWALSQFAVLALAYWSATGGPL